MIAVLCPGQGSQTPGMLLPWLERADARDRLAAFSEAAGVDLETHGTVSDAETIRDTAVAQPLIVATSLLALREVLEGRSAEDVVDVTAGHSVGELTAAAVAGVLDDASAVALVAHRARAMATAAAAAETGMSAVVGGEPEAVLAAIAAAGLFPANVNGGGQVVAAGCPDGLAQLAENPPARARVIPLQVAGAFHTTFMQAALDAFAPVATGWSAQDPRLPFLTNADGSTYGTRGPGTHGHGTASDVVGHLIAQIVAPVRWDLCQDTLTSLGVTAVLELAPGGVLAGLAKRTLKGVELLAIKSPDDIDAARDLVARHSGTTATSTEETTA